MPKIVEQEIFYAQFSDLAEYFRYREHTAQEGLTVARGGMPDPRIIPGARIETRYGEAVVVSVTPHVHRQSMVTRNGRVYHPCEDDTCQDAVRVYYRYEAKRPGQDTPIWVLNSDLTDGRYEPVRYLGPPTKQTRAVLLLKGPYGEDS